jgi:hypothetical protein
MKKEDRIDAEIALERIKMPNRKFYTTEEARQILIDWQLPRNTNSIPNKNGDNFKKGNYVNQS